MDAGTLSALVVQSGSLLGLAALAWILNRRARRHRQELAVVRDDLVLVLTAIMKAVDWQTHRHSRRVARFAVAIGRRMHLRSRELALLWRGALVHDIGKLALPDGLLDKPGGLDAEERRLVEQHPLIGHDLVAPVAALGPVAEIVRQHHEAFGGGGYPLGHKGEEIPLLARIVTVADALEAMLSDRPYRKGRPLWQAVSEIERCAGTQFDPRVVAALRRLVQEMPPSWFDPAAEAEALGVAASLDPLAAQTH